MYRLPPVIFFFFGCCAGWNYKRIWIWAKQPCAQKRKVILMYFGQQEWQGLAVLRGELAMECLKGRPWGFVPSCLRSLKVCSSQSFQNWWSSLFRWDVKMACGKTSFPSGHSVCSSTFKVTSALVFVWRWLMCFIAATSPLSVLFAGMMEWKSLVCIVLSLAGC